MGGKRFCADETNAAKRFVILPSLVAFLQVGQFEFRQGKYQEYSPICNILSESFAHFKSVYRKFALLQLCQKTFDGSEDCATCLFHCSSVKISLVYVQWLISFVDEIRYSARFSENLPQFFRRFRCSVEWTLLFNRHWQISLTVYNENSFDVVFASSTEKSE